MNFHKFLKGLEPNANGHLIEDIWGFSDREINANHDFIQTLFPLDEPNNWSLNKLYLEDSKEIEKIRFDPIAVGNILKSKEWFLEFLKRNDSWQYFHNHNQLRITRIIKSLILLVSREEAHLFYEEILSSLSHDAKIPDVSFEYWTSSFDANLLREVR